MEMKDINPDTRHDSTKDTFYVRITTDASKKTEYLNLLKGV